MVEVVFYNENIINLRVPTFVELAVVDTPPGFKGDTAQGGTKPAKLETGLITQIPLFINNGEKIRIDTRSGDYVERVS